MERSGPAARSSRPVDLLRDRVVDQVTSLFAHGNDPLARTFEYVGDPGLHGPDSMTWRVLGDVSSFVGGVRALLVQSAHPEVVAGVRQHSAYETDPLGRLSRTSDYVTAMSFGALPEVDAAVRGVRAAHGRVHGVSARKRPYRASDPALMSWVHNALTDSFLAAHQAYGAEQLTPEEADRFVVEQARVGARVGATDLPTTARELTDWIVGHPDVDHSTDAALALRFLWRPPLPAIVRPGYRLVRDAAVATVEPELRELLDLRAAPGARARGRLLAAGLRWSLGFSPAWHAALVRVGAPVPEGRFRRSVVAGHPEPSARLAA